MYILYKYVYKYKYKSYLYQNLIDTDITSVFFVFICELGCAVDERKSRQTIFKVMIKSKIFNWLDLSDDFWDQFGVQNKKSKKQVGLFEIENINKANIITIALNPKEYYGKREDHSDNKKGWKNELLEWILIRTQRDYLILMNF